MYVTVVMNNMYLWLLIRNVLWSRMRYQTVLLMIIPKLLQPQYVLNVKVVTTLTVLNVQLSILNLVQNLTLMEPVV